MASIRRAAMIQELVAMLDKFPKEAALDTAPQPMAYTIGREEVPELTCRMPPNPPKPWGKKARRQKRFN